MPGSGPLASFWPSVVIALSVSAAFVAGRLAAWLTPPSARQIVWIVVLVLSLAVAAFFLVSRSSRYAQLLPAAFALGFLSHGRPTIGPGVFRS